MERRRLGRGGAALRAGTLSAASAAALADALAAPVPATVEEVIASMRAIERALPPRDGVAAFTRLYLRVTEAVAVEMAPGGFRNAIFLARLDVLFANLYFDALRVCLRRPDEAPRAWRPLFEARGRSGIAPIQFALAGMNAHINRDLPVALVATCAELGVELRRGGDEHADYLRVNDVLVATEARVKREFAAGLLAIADHALGTADDAVAMWNVARARDAAWVNAETLWALGGAREVRERYLRTLDGMVGLAGRGLLRPGVRQSLRRRVLRRVRTLVRA